MKTINSTCAIFIITIVTLLAGCGLLNSTKKSDATSDTKTTGTGKKSGSKVDACSLLTKADAEAILGGPVKEPTRNEGEREGTVVSQCHYSDTSAKKQVGLLARQSPTIDESKQVFQNARNASKGLSGVDPQTVSGLGDDAYWAGGRLNQFNVLKGDVWLIITISPAKEDRLGANKAAANKILAHMQ